MESVDSQQLSSQTILPTVYNCACQGSIGIGLSRSSGQGAARPSRPGRVAAKHRAAARRGTLLGVGAAHKERWSQKARRRGLRRVEWTV